MQQLSEGGALAPPYLFRYFGPVLVCGSAVCLYDDLKRAREIFPYALTIAVNGASKLVPAIALYSKHPERFIERRWLDGQRFFFGNYATVHADVKAATRPSCIDYWWSGLWGGGGSAWDARKLAFYMGFSPVVLCGCPLEAGPHVGSHGFASFMHREDVVDAMRKGLEEETEWHRGAYSMSGWTRELLGEPTC